ncbi:MAG: HepT-like ribonuclease domain-containing protein [Ornithinimicrobium sp.]
MDRKAAKELLHIQGWLNRVDEIAERGKEAYLGDDLLQEAGDSLMMKLGEAANRLSRLGVLAPEGVEWAIVVANRNFLIHQYDEINRELTWLTLPVTCHHGRPRCSGTSRHRKRPSVKTRQTKPVSGSPQNIA